MEKCYLHIYVILKKKFILIRVSLYVKKKKTKNKQTQWHILLEVLLVLLLNNVLPDLHVGQGSSGAVDGELR